MMPWLEWIVLAVFLVAAIHVDIKYITRCCGEVSLKASSVRCVYWLFVALVFQLVVAWQLLGEGEAWFAGYLLEYTLSVDNLFVFQLMFKMFLTPADQIDKALLWGISAAAAMRLVFFIVGTKMIDWISWIKYPFGVLLLWTAWRTFQAARKSESVPPGSVPSPPIGIVNVIAFAERHLPFVAQYDKGGKFLSSDEQDLVEHPGQLPVTRASSNSKSIVPKRLTMLGAVVFALALVDVIFALDAVAAKVSQSRDLFVNFSSSLLAMMSFRSLYHVIVELTVTFSLLKYGIALVLGYVGLELIISNWTDIPSHLSCIMILAICFGSIAGSLVMNTVGKFPDDDIIAHIELATLDEDDMEEERLSGRQSPE
jgi:tellurite resistance protein TerC